LRQQCKPRARDPPHRRECPHNGRRRSICTGTERTFSIGSDLDQIVKGLADPDVFRTSTAATA
jgi:hypothetical protein